MTEDKASPLIADVLGRLLELIKKHGTNPSSLSFSSSREEIGYYDAWADFWRYVIGVNVIPAKTKLKKTFTDWKHYQNSPIPERQHDAWKNEGEFKDGMAVMAGKVWHRPDKVGQYFIIIDADTQIAIEELSARKGKTVTLDSMASSFLVEQHKDNSDKAHIYFYSPISFVSKGPDRIIGIEVKSAGEHGISFCCPSHHQNIDPRDGNEYRYEIIGTPREPVTLTILQATEMMQHINRICIKFRVQYLEKDVRLMRVKPMIRKFVIDPTIRIPRGERHLTLLPVADSLLLKYSGNGKTDDEIKAFFMQINDKLCDPEPLAEDEINEIWQSATDYINRVREEHTQEKEEDSRDIIEEASEAIMTRHRVLTIEETKDILYYRNGVYVPGGEILIEKEAERIYGYQLSNRHLSEIKGHIIRSTYHTHDEFDSDLNIINLKNGLYNLQTGEFKEHSPDYLSINQVPVVYNPALKPKLFGKYLCEVLYPAEIRTAIELLGYTLYRANPFEIIVILFGYGANGKSVFTGLVTSLHGSKNISNVPLSSMQEDRFALSDLEGKAVNIDTELTSTTIRDASILKKLTGRQPTRIQRKNQRAYDALLYAKLVFSANRIPSSNDESDAYFRRKVILGFPNRFEGNRDDPDLIKKLTTEEELSGILNVLLIALRRALNRNGIFVKEKTIEQRRERYVLAASPIEAFLDDAVAEDSVESDEVPKEEFYQAYKRFCNDHSLAVLSKETFGKNLKRQVGKWKLGERREASGERRTLWTGVKLEEKYHVELRQETLNV